MKEIDYKKRLQKSFEAMLIILDLSKPSAFKTLKRMINAQLRNLENLENKPKA